MAEQYLRGAGRASQEERPAYAVIEITIRDQAAYTDYIARAKPTVEAHGGRYLVRGGRVVTMSGDWYPERMIVIRFPTFGALEACFNSEAYKALMPLRDRAVSGRAVVLEGLL